MQEISKEEFNNDGLVPPINVPDSISRMTKVGEITHVFLT